jgi:RNA polymerase sigma-70 factor (ECF subfamily)
VDSSGPPTVERLLAHREWLRRLAAALVRDPNRADDLEQDVWVRALESPPRAGGSLRAWLGTVLRRRAIDQRRADDRRVRRESVASAARPGRGGDEGAEAEEARRLVTQAVMALEPRYRDTVLLRYFGDHPIAEVARRQGLPVETVRTRLRRALGALRARLGATDARPGTALLLLLASAGAGSALPPSASATPCLVPAPAASGATAMGSKLAVGLTCLGVGAVVLAAWSVRGGGETSDDVSRSGGGEVARVDAPPDAPSAPPPPVLEGRPRAARPVPEPDAPAPSAPSAPPPSPDTAGRGDRVAGRILDAGGKPVPGATVSLEPAATPVSAVPPDGALPIGEGGEFRFDGIAPGEYRLTVRADGFVAVTVPVRPGEADVRVVLDPAASLAGVVVEKGTGLPVAGLEVSARTARSPTSAAAYRSVSGPDGRFRFGDLPAGEYVLAAGSLFQVGNDAGDEFLAATFGPTPNGALDLRLEVVRGLPIAGVLREPDGRATARTLLVEATGRTERGDSDWVRRRGARSRPDGRFRIGGLPPGAYRVVIRLATSEGLVEGGPAVTRLEGVTAGTEDLVVDLREGAVVRGVLVDDAGSPVTEGGYVYVYPHGTVAGSEESVATRPDAEGRFHSAPLDPARRYDVLAAGFSGVMQQTAVKVVPGGAEVRIEMRRAGTIRGRVVDATGRPVPDGVGVTAVCTTPAAGTAPGRSGVAYTRGRGTFTLEGLGPFPFTLRAGGAQSAYVTAEEATGVLPGAAEVVLEVRLGVRVRGRLEDEAGRPVGSTHLLAFGEGAGSTLPCWGRASAEDGRFEFPGLPPGPFTMRGYVGEKFVELGRFDTATEEVVVVVPGP